MKLTKLFSPRVLGLIISTLLFASFVFAAAGDVDTAFAPNLKRDIPVASGSIFAIQSDGKILVAGFYRERGGNVTRTLLYRLNADGTEDATFAQSDYSAYLGSILPLPNGKFLVAGSSSFNFGVMLLRFNSNGTIDTSFSNPNAPCGGTCNINLYAAQPDGKFYATDSFSGAGGGSETLRRRNADGSVDNTFAGITFRRGGSNSDFIGKLTILSDGKLMICGRQFPNGILFRLNTDGTKDTSFESPVTTNVNVGSSFVPSLNSFIMKSNGSLIVAGNFTSINGLVYPAIARLNSNGSVDSNYSATAFPNIPLDIKPLSNGKYIVPSSTYVRFNADDTVDATFNQSSSVNPDNFLIDSQDRIITSVYRLNFDGSLDTLFNPFTPTIGGKVSRIFRQPDGKIIAAGDFSKANSITRTRLVRLNTDGTTDNTFDAGSGFDVDPIVLTMQSDGKILAGGIFTTFNGVPKTGLVRLNADGSLDSTFIGTFDGSIQAVLPLSTGKILIGGGFSSFSGTARPRLARLNADGTLDSTFNASVSGGGIYSILLQSDGKIMVSGSFAGIGGFARTNYARLNSDGSVDSTFNAGTSLAGSLTIVQNSGGKYLLMLTSPSNSNSIIRLNADGSNDGSFQSVVLGGLSRLSAMSVQADGLIVIGGAFNSVSGVPKNNFARLKSNGALDAAYVFEGADDQVNAIVAQPDGKLIVGGNFSTIGGVARTGLARINNIALIGVRPLFDFDGDGKADVAVFRPSTGVWYRLLSGNSQVAQTGFAISGDIPVPADYDGDGKTDLAIFRQSSGDWWYLSSLSGTQVFNHWGQNGDIPRPSDFDGDGKTDFVIYRPSELNWYRYGSTGQISTKNFGSPGDKPVIGDFDGDGKSDVAIFRPSTGDWWYQSSVDNSQRATHFGVSTDVPTPADFDGDGKTDFAVYRPATGTWYILGSSTGAATVVNFGLAEDKPVAADYDGDGKADIAVFRPSTGIWYLLRSNAGFSALQFGINSDVPVPNSFVP
jgi:uncharacterized delta-60 repeat protein